MIAAVGSPLDDLNQIKRKKGNTPLEPASILRALKRSLEQAQRTATPSALPTLAHSMIKVLFGSEMLDVWANTA